MRPRVRQKTLIEHLVDLVEHQDAHVTEVQQTALEKLEQTPRRRDQYFEQTGDVPLRDLESRAAEHGAHAQARGVRERFEDARDLLAEFARRDHDEGARLPLDADRVPFVLEDLEHVQHGQHVRERLAAAGLRDADDGAPCRAAQGPRGSGSRSG